MIVFLDICGKLCFPLAMLLDIFRECEQKQNEKWSIYTFDHVLHEPIDLKDFKEDTSKEENVKNDTNDIFNNFDIYAFTKALTFSHTKILFVLNRYFYPLSYSILQDCDCYVLSDPNLCNEHFSNSIHATSLYSPELLYTLLTSNTMPQNYIYFESMRIILNEKKFSLQKLLDEGYCSYCNQKFGHINIREHLFKEHKKHIARHILKPFHILHAEVIFEQLTKLPHTINMSFWDGLSYTPILFFDVVVTIENKSLLNPFLIQVEHVNSIPQYDLNDWISKHLKYVHKEQHQIKEIKKIQEIQERYKEIDDTNELTILKQQLQTAKVMYKQQKNTSFVRSCVLGLQFPFNSTLFQVLASYGLRRKFTQCKDDLFALQCSSFIYLILKKDQKEQDEQLLKALAENVILPVFKKEQEPTTPFEKWVNIQSYIHLFAILFALKISDNKLYQIIVSRIYHDSFSSYWIKHVFLKLLIYHEKEEEFELERLFVSDYPSKVKYFYSSPYLKSSLQEARSKFFFTSLLDKRKCVQQFSKILMWKAMNVSNDQFFQLLSLFFEKPTTFEDLFSDMDFVVKWLAVSMIRKNTDLNIEHFISHYFELRFLAHRQKIKTLQLKQMEKEEMKVINNKINNMNNMNDIHDMNDINDINDMNDFKKEDCSIHALHNGLLVLKSNFLNIEHALQKIHQRDDFKLECDFNTYRALNACMKCFKLTLCMETHLELTCPQFLKHFPHFEEASVTIYNTNKHNPKSFVFAMYAHYNKERRGHDLFLERYWQLKALEQHVKKQTITIPEEFHESILWMFRSDLLVDVSFRFKFGTCN